ncbi:putative AAA ATPase [Skeletonema marinoi]|uniref:AAA ATPase n=1 Tax=Skeletonema marinoi TaxID=267567 RepID=A0AAD8Y9P5_9STRA|nr:putative AAA ATPase [Skeletonema marinoi]
MSEQRKPLSEWIRSFHTFLDQFCNIGNHATVSLSSSDYLILALRLTCSLADEICRVGEETGRSPTPRFDWMDSIVVCLKSNSSKGDGTENVVNTILTDDDDGIRVEVLPSLFDKTENYASQMDGILYSLGIVFFEIFSRGERPAELEQTQIGETTPNVFGAGAEELYEGFNPFQQGGTIDAGELSMYKHLLSDYNLSDDDSTSSEKAFQGDGPRKKRTQNENYNMCSVSVEPLIEKGVPMSLCDLIANMLDCANGTLRKDETYSDVSEVRDDLQLMLDKPSIYLYDQNMGRLSTTGLQFGDTVFGRNAELSTIKEAYRRAVSGDSEVVTIYGQSGTGKSLLAYEFGKYVLADGVILLSGKFDQLQQGTPFSALASAFNQYCGILLQSCELSSSRGEMLAHQINHVLGREANHLAKLIPNLANILCLDTSGIIHDEGCTNAQNRLQYLLCRLVEVISSTFAAPVTLFLDDLQWADSASIAAVNQLLLGGLASQNTHFFFLGCHRDGEADNCNPLWKSLCYNNLVNARSTDVKLDCMGEETLSTMVSETLCLSPRLTRSLSSVIYHKTKGNPLFVSRLMISLNKEGLLRPSLSRRRWEWDKEKIQCQKLPDDVAMFLTKSIKALSEDVKSSLSVLSCFGSSVECAFIKTLEKVLKKNLLRNLDAAVEEGLLDKKDGRYHFSHDRIQEAAYNMMNFLDRCHFHFTYGMALAPLSVREKDDSNLLIAVNQLNLASPEAVQERSQNVIIAKLNLQAGKKTMEMSDFVAAYSYFDNGISFLRKKHWEEHYALSLELFDLAAKCALTNGDIVSLKILSEQVIAYGRSYGDKLNVLYSTTCALAFSSKLPESIDKGLDILANLGIELRGCRSSMEACVQETKDLLSAYTDDEILNTRPMTDPTMIIAMKFLGKLEIGMSQIMPKSAPFVMQQIIQLSLLHGMSPVSPIGFVHLGSYMAKLGDISEGYRYVKLSRSLLDKVGSRDSAGEVISIGTQVRAYVEPLQATLEYHNEGFAAAMSSGDVIQAALNLTLICTTSLFAAANLQITLDKCVETDKFLYERKMVIFMIQNKCLHHSMFKLIGTDENPKDFSEEEVKILATNNSVMTSYYFQKAFISFTFRMYDDSKHYSEKYLDCIVNTWANLLFAHSYHAFYMGLISFWLARKSGDEQQWHERGKRSKLALKKWAESCQWTFENKWYLLEAEESYCNNDFDRAKLYYEKAISSAKDHKFVHEEALAYELAAYFYLELGDAEKAMEYFLLAHEKYHEWGAFGKCNSLFKFVESRFTPSSASG